MGTDQPSPDDLLAVIDRQQRQIEVLQALVARLTAELDEARRAGKWQAAPFARRPPEADPRQPGHKPAHRPPPDPDRVDRRVVAPLPTHCTGGGDMVPSASRSPGTTSTRSTCRHRGRPGAFGGLEPADTPASATPRGRAASAAWSLPGVAARGILAGRTRITRPPTRPGVPPCPSPSSSSGSD